MVKGDSVLDDREIVLLQDSDKGKNKPQRDTYLSKTPLSFQILTLALRETGRMGQNSQTCP